MPNRKPPASAPSPIKIGPQPATRRNAPGSAPNPRLKTDSRWQRSKRYGWDSR